jgi:hypothetical protein
MRQQYMKATKPYNRLNLDNNCLFAYVSARRKVVACTHRTAETQNEHTQTSMPQVGSEPTISVFERANTVYALDRAATMIGFEYT